MKNLSRHLEDDSKTRECVSRAQADKINFDNDERRKVTDTSQYPHMAIARTSMWFLGDPNQYSGTGFLADGHIFITCAHNVRDDMKSPNPARSVVLGSSAGFCCEKSSPCERSRWANADCDT